MTDATQFFYNFEELSKVPADMEVPKGAVVDKITRSDTAIPPDGFDFIHTVRLPHVFPSRFSMDWLWVSLTSMISWIP
eukprot:2181375-Ditylum_brightwellii.AAC.2